VRAGLVHVYVRVGLVAHQHRAVLNDVVGDVGVQVQADGDRQLRRDGANALQA
jgi:hypothetical protein